MKLGKKINFLRKKRGLTLEALAKKVGSSKGYIWELENNDKIKPSAEKIKKIATLLEVTVDYLLSPEMLEPNEDEETLIFAREMKNLSPELREMLKKQVRTLQELEKKHKK